MKKAVQILLLLLLALGLSCGNPGLAEELAEKNTQDDIPQESGQFNRQSGINIRETLIVDGLVRNAIVHLPAGYRQEESLPLVIILHGAKLSAKIAQLVTEFDKLSNANQFIVAYPNALNRQWNDGRSQGLTPSYGIDDVGFISRLIDSLINKYNVNPNKVYVAGYSSGGMLSQKLGMEMTDKITAIAEVASSLPMAQLELNRKPTRPLPVLMINGTRDPAFPWVGGDTHIVGIKVGPVAPIMVTVQYWINANGGLVAPPVFNRLNPRGRGGAVDVAFFPTSQGTGVLLYKINGGGHTWPGSEVPLRYIPFLGRESKDLKASELIWEFFKNY